MKELNQDQHIQLLQFMSLMQTCKTEEEIQELKNQYYNIPRFSFLQEYVSDKNEEQTLSSYKTNLIYDMDKYQQDYKFVYGENFPAYKKGIMPNNKADFTVMNLLDEISQCDDIEAYQKLFNENKKFPKAEIEALSPSYTGVYYSDKNDIIGLPSFVIKNNPENNFNTRKQLVEAGYSPFNFPSVEDVRENGFGWLHEEISLFKETLNPNFVELENQMNQESEFYEDEAEEYLQEYDDFIEQMDANGGLSSIAAEADYNAFYEGQEDIDEVQRQMDMDNGLIDENGNEILFDVPEIEPEEDLQDMTVNRIFNHETITRKSLSDAEEQRLQEDFDVIGRFENAVGEWSEYSNVINFFDFQNHSDEFLKFMDAAREEKEISGHKDNISFVQHYLENKLEIPVYKDGERISPSWTDEEKKKYSPVTGKLNLIAQAIVNSNEAYIDFSSGVGRNGVIHNTEMLERFGAKNIEELEKTLQKMKDEINPNYVWQEKNKKYLRETELNKYQEVSLFDKELQEFIDGKLPKSHIFSLGKPSEILVKCGFPAEQRIELSASHLEFKSKLDWHPFDMKDVMGLEEALKSPIAVFEYGDRKKSQNIIINIEKDGKNFLAGVHFNQEHNGFEISTIRTLFPKDTVEWLNWMNQGKMIYGDKEKLQALIAQQRINVADVNSQVAQSPLYEHCLESSSSILDKFGEVKDIFADEYPFYGEIKKKAAIEQKFFNFYVTKGNLDARELSVFESEEFYNALISGNTSKIDEYTKTDLHEINELAAEIYEAYTREKDKEQEYEQNPLQFNMQLHEESDLNQNISDTHQNELEKTVSQNSFQQRELIEKLTEEEFDKYIHSEEFISKFGDWEKAARLQKLVETPTIIKNGRVIIEGEDVTEEVNNFRNEKDNKILRIFAKDIGRSVKGIYHNDDLNIDVVLSMGNIDEIKNHHMSMSGHIEAIQYIPDIIKQGVFIAEEPNEDKRKHPNIEKYKYFVSALNIDGVDYTCKSAIGVDKDGNHYYDQRLSQIEKGLLLDNLSQLMSRGKSEQSLLNYDKRLLRICQCPQALYLDKELKPTKKVVQSVKDGKLYLEKDKNGFQLLHDIKRKKIIGKEISEMIEKNVENNTNIPDNAQNKLGNPSPIVESQSNIEESEHNNNPDENIPVENVETKAQVYENNNLNSPASKPKNTKELHQFFINNPYVAGTPVPKIAMMNEQSGHYTFIEGYDFARFEDIGKPNPAFFKEDKKTGKMVRVKPDGQTVVLTKPGFRKEINKKTGEEMLVPDETKRKFIKISRDLYEQVISNSEIIAKRNPKTEQEHNKMIEDYEEAAHLDEKKQRDNTASNFWHNYQAGVMTLANNKQEAMAFAKRLVNEMIPSERKKFANMVREYEKKKGAGGKHLSYDQRILDTYEEITKGLTITNNSIWRDRLNSKYNTPDEIKQNTEVFDKEGQPLDKACRMKVGDTIKIFVTVDSALSNKKIKLPVQEYRLVAHSKDNNSVALISADGKQKIIKNREDFIKEVQKIEKKQLKKQQKQDRYEAISM